MDINILISQISSTEEYFIGRIARTIDRHLTIRNWLIGYYIVEYEQNGKDRAEYGQALLQNLADQLATKGLSHRSLKLFRQFFVSYPQLGQTVSAFLDNEIRQTPSAQSGILQILQTPSVVIQEDVEAAESQALLSYTQVEKLLSNLSFSHFVELMKIENRLKRSYYELEATKACWSVRELKRQINSLNFERSATAKNPSILAKTLGKSNDIINPKQIIKTPYVFDFLGLPDGVLGTESALEAALVNDLKNFILELGHGFCFEAQQKRIVIGGEYFFIDLVFYHRILKCHVIIELKIDEFSHANAGQLNTYIQYYKSNIQQESDNPPIGILLCTNKNEELVQYALGGMDENIFVSQYKTVLPSTAALERFLKQEKSKL